MEIKGLATYKKEINLWEMKINKKIRKILADGNKGVVLKNNGDCIPSNFGSRLIAVVSE